MAATKDQGMAVAGCNYVAQDRIWKSHVNQEMTAAKKWPNNWQFLTTKYEDLVKDDFPKQDKERLTLTPAQPPAPKLEDLVTVHPSTRPVPKTTAAQVGWRSTDKQLALERYGAYAKPKGSIIKSLKWPDEAID